MRTCKVLKLSALDQILTDTLYKEKKEDKVEINETDFKSIYEENCKFHKWIDYPYTKKETVYGMNYVNYVRDEPHGLIEYADGHTDLVHYSKIVFTDIEKSAKSMDFVEPVNVTMNLIEAVNIIKCNRGKMRRIVWPQDFYITVGDYIPKKMDTYLFFPEKSYARSNDGIVKLTVGDIIAIDWIVIDTVE